MGLIDSEEQAVNLDFNWSLTDTAVLYLHAGHRSIDSVQTGSRIFSAPLWRAGHDDRFRSFGGGFRIAKLFEVLELNADVQVTRGDTEIDVSLDGAALEPIPDLEADETSARIRATYARSENLSLTFEIDYSQLETNDWALTGIGPTTAPALFALGAESGISVAGP